ncbi:unnamed protein product, partial [Polarella glacialis]
MALDAQPCLVVAATPPSAQFLCFGEAMIRYCPETASSAGAPRWLQSVGGAELNVAVALSRLGWSDSRWVSVVPRGPLGDHLMTKVGEAMRGGANGLALVRREEGD